MYQVDDSLRKRLIVELRTETTDSLPLIHLIVKAWCLIPINENNELQQEVEKCLQRLSETDRDEIVEQFEEKKRSIKEIFYGSTKTWAVKAKGNEKQKHCRFCGGNFTKKADSVAVSCDYCRNELNQFHSFEAVAVSKYKSAFICPSCLQNEEWQISLEEVRKQQLQLNKIIYATTEINVNDAENDDTYFLVMANNWDNQIFIQDSFIPQRILKLSTKDAKKMINNYQKLLDDYFYKRLDNVKYKLIPNGVNIKRGYDYYFKQFGSKSDWTPESLGYKVPDTNVQFWVANFGPGEFNSFCGFGSILDEIEGAPEQCKLLKDIIHTEIFPQNQQPQNMKLMQEKCHSSFYSDTSKGFSIKDAYKGMSTCIKGVTNKDEKMLQEFLEKAGEDDNNLALYFDTNMTEKLKKLITNINEAKEQHNFSLINKLMKKKKKMEQYFKNIKPKLKVVPSTAQDLIDNMPRGPQFLHQLKRIRTLMCIFQIAIALEYPQLKVPMMQYITKKEIFDGKELRGGDVLVYDKGHSVAGHVDDSGFIQQEMPCNGNYAVAKIDVDASSSMFCNWSESGGKKANCCWKRRHPHHINYGGHHELKKMCVYFMLRKGAFGGPEHSLHGMTQYGAKNLWNGFETSQTTLVFRPYLV